MLLSSGCRVCVYKQFLSSETIISRISPSSAKSEQRKTKRKNEEKKKKESRILAGGNKNKSFGKPPVGKASEREWLSERGFGKQRGDFVEETPMRRREKSESRAFVSRAIAARAGRRGSRKGDKEGACFANS